ncbi:MAG: helix-hairpin-helix domain-containing protein [Verrucomicrobiota bacterium]
MATPKRKKKVDTEALQSNLMRIPRMKTEVARDLIDVGVREVYQLEGRSPEVLFDDLRRKKPEAPEDRLPYFRMAVYFAETPLPESSRMRPEAWL